MELYESGADKPTTEDEGTAQKFTDDTTQTQRTDLQAASKLNERLTQQVELLLDHQRRIGLQLSWMVTRTRQLETTTKKMEKQARAIERKYKTMILRSSLRV